MATPPAALLAGGLERALGALGMRLLQRVEEAFVEAAKIQQYPRMEAWQMLMVLAPK